MESRRQTRVLRAVAATMVLALAACTSTKVNTRLALEPAKTATLKYDNVVVTSPLSDLPTDLTDRLKSAVTARLAQVPQGASPVKLELTINQFRVVDPTNRFLVGVLAGASVMSVRVQILDAQGNSLSDLDVMRSANHGIYGALMDEKGGLIESSADGIAEALGAPKK